MNQVSYGYIMGFLCGYMNRQIDPGVFGYHRGYTQKTASEGPAPVEPEAKKKPCKCGKPGCQCKPQATQPIG